MERLQILLSTTLKSRFLPRRSPVIVTFLLLFIFLVFNGTALAANTTSVLDGGIAINEVLPDPNSASNNFDTDGNGTADTGDEFVEIYNLSALSIDISGFELWDDGVGLWFTFPAATTLGAGNFAVVIAGVQAGGSLPTLTPGNLAFDAGNTGGVINNGGDNVVLYDPGADQYIQLTYNGDAADDPPIDYIGFAGTATLVGSVENWGSDTDGVSLVREPDGDTNVVQHNTISSDLASPGRSSAAVEAAPSVSSTTPSNGATNVALDANIDINFSEDVTVTGSWYEISCNASGPHTATASGGPKSYTLDPDADFDNDENCTITVNAAQVADTDTDDPPDNMVGDYVFSFDTVTAAGPPMLVISEIMYNPASAEDDWEWVEIYNAGSTAVDLAGYVIDDINSVAHGSANIASGSVDPGQTAVLYNADDITAADFIAAWGSDVNLVAVSHWSAMGLNNSGDRVGLWDSFASYSGDHATHANTIVDVDFDDSSPWPVDDGSASIYLTDLAADANDGNNWALSTVGGITPTFIGYPSAAAGGNSGNDVGSPAEQPIDLVISEIMYNPASSEDDWEWVEIYNAGPFTIDLSGFVIDDNNGTTHSTANITSGSIEPGQTAVLYNADDVTAADYTAAWGPGINLVAVSHWSAMGLNNGGDQVGLWDSFASYSGDHTTHANTIVDVAYDDSSGWPADDGSASISLTDLAADANDGSNWALSTFGGITPTFIGYQSAAAGGNSGNDVGSPGPGSCGDVATPIHEIQGSGSSSPFVGYLQAIEGIVTGDFESTSTGLSGFFIQEETGDFDGDGATSEGIFVFNNGVGSVNSGDTVRVRGTVAEFFGFTELNNVVSVNGCPATGTTAPALWSLPVASVNDWEWVEGMEVFINQTLYASGNFTQARFGEVDLSVGAPLDNPTNVVAPGAPAIALQDLNDRSRIQLDDASTVENPLPLPPYLGIDNTLRTGDSLPGLTGNVNYAFGTYQIEPTQPVNFTRANARPDVPYVGGTIQVAAYNVLNYFTTIDNGSPICGPLSNQDCRGADTASEFTRQRDKIVSAISTLGAHVVGLMEIENAPDNTPEANLVAGLNAATAPGVYDYIAAGPIGGDAIRVALLYQPASVTPFGGFEVLDSSDDPLFDDTLNRPMLVQSFVENVTGEVFTVAVNHLKSKGSDCNDVGDPDTGDGQGNCNVTRTNAAQAIVDFLATDPTGSGDSDYLVIGDLNSYAQEDPIVTIEAGSYTDLIEAFVGTGFGSGAYSYNFFSQSGYLDHGLASETMTPQVTGADFWHVNADEPSGLDYNNYNQPLLYNPDEFRSSDHDPVVIGLFPAKMLKETASLDLSLLLPADDNNTDKQLNKAIDNIEASLNPAWWTSDQSIIDKKVFDNERQAIVQLELIVASGVPEVGAAQATIDVLLTADRQLAQIELIAAIARGGSATKIADAEAAMAEAAALRALGLHNEAVNAYSAAWDAATKA
jgi:predicted extracellular nuclease